MFIFFFQLMVEDILQHEVMLDDVELKGESLVASNRGAPKLADNIRAQVKQLKDGYSNLFTSAKQNKVRNLMSLFYNLQHKGFSCEIFFH